MSIFSRLNTVLKSNLNALVDKAEDPEKLIGQTVIDMKAELKRARRELISTMGASKRLDKKVLELTEEVDSWERKAVLALKEGDDDLAREALKQKARINREKERCQSQADQELARADEMKDTLERVERQIDDLEARQSSLAAQVRQSRQSTSTSGSRYGSSAFDDLERMTGRIDQLDAEVEAHSVLEDPDRAALDAKFRRLEKDAGSSEVDDELAALKKKLEG